MIWSAAVLVGILVWLLLLYVSRGLRGPSGAIGLEPITRVTVLSNKIRVTVTLPSADAEYQITQALFPRELGERLGIAAPPGFRAVPYTLDDAGRPTNDDAKNWVEESNRNDIRWLGSVPLQPDMSTTLNFPIRGPANGEGALSFQYERKDGMGGQTSFIVVPVIVAEG